MLSRNFEHVPMSLSRTCKIIFESYIYIHMYGLSLFVWTINRFLYDLRELNHDGIILTNPVSGCVGNEVVMTRIGLIYIISLYSILI